ncbi:MAG: DNA-3-methyladenine glycosylase I, partial [Angustibacter sp.]
LRKREAFRAAFAGFDPEAVAAFDDTDRERLMADAGIVRNRLKVDAAIANARAVLGLREQGGLEDLVWSHRPEQHTPPRSTAELRATSPESVALAKALKKAGFVFVGPTTMYAAMQACGLVDDHLLGCHRAGGPE